MKGSEIVKVLEMISPKIMKMKDQDTKQDIDSKKGNVTKKGHATQKVQENVTGKSH